MAPKQAIFLLAATLLFLLCLRSQAARPEPKSNGQPQVVEEATKSAIGDQQEKGSMEMEMDQEQEMKECGGGEGMEECLMRRTLVAHTDYIYTQGKHN